LRRRGTILGALFLRRRGEARRPTPFTTPRRLWRTPRRRHTHIVRRCKLEFYILMQHIHTSFVANSCVNKTEERRLSNIKAEHEQGASSMSKSRHYHTIFSAQADISIQYSEQRARSMSKSRAQGIKYYNTQSRDGIPGTRYQARPYQAEGTERRQGHTRRNREEHRGGRGTPGGRQTAGGG
jgi:hypothetical protein